MKIKKILAFLVASSLSLTAFVGCGDSDDTSTAEDGTELTTLRVAIMTGQADQYATYIGSEQGIFEKYGIELTTAEYAAGINTMDAVQNGTADTGLLADFALVNRIGNTLDDTNLVTFSELTGGRTGGDTTGGLYVAEEYADNLEGLYDSPGIITNIGTVSEYQNWLALTYIGLDPDKVENINSTDVSSSLSLVSKGEVGAVIASGATAERYEEYGMVLVATSDEIGIATRSYLMTTTDFLDDNTELLGDYLVALEESVEYITEHLDEVTPDIASKFGIEEDDFQSNWNNLQFNLGFTEEGAQKLEDVAAWAYENGKYDTEYDVRQFIDTSASVLAFGEDSDKITVELS